MKMVNSFQGEVWEDVLAESPRLAMAGQHHHNVVLPAQVPGVSDGVPGVSDEYCHSFAACSTHLSTVPSAPVRLYLSMHNIAEQARMCSALLTDLPMDGKAPRPFHCQLSYAQSCTLHHNSVAVPVRRICWVPPVCPLPGPPLTLQHSGSNLQGPCLPDDQVHDQPLSYW